MKTNKWFVALLLGSVLVGCQGKTETEPDGNDQINEGTEKTEPDREEGKTDNDSEDQSDEETDKNDKDGAEDSVDKVTEEDYPTEEEAGNAIENYEKVEETNTDLGHGIEALMEAGAGHQYVSWNEGNWLIRIDFPLDPENAIDDYEGGESMAREIVEYLEENRLPAPNQYGVVDIRSFKDHPETVISWQDGKVVYKIDEKVSDPMDALKIAVDFERSR